MPFLQKFIRFTLFSNIYLAGIIVLACYATCIIFNVQASTYFYAFIFCSTCSSYCLHWALETNLSNNNIRQKWSFSNKKLLVIFSIIAFIVGCIYFYYLPSNAFVLIAPLAFFTFLYTAPKINVWPFTKLRQLVFAKTIYLTVALTYTTVVLPIFLFNKTWQTNFTVYSLQRAFIIFVICLLFDYRDRHLDLQQGIKSFLYKFSEKQILYVVHLLLIIALLLSVSFIIIAKLFLVSGIYVHVFLPIIILALISKKAIRSNNIYLYYGLLDLLLAIHAIGLLFQ